jgi:uncharacterized membrane protein HdeD (DUF308 family)
LFKSPDPPSLDATDGPAQIYQAFQDYVLKVERRSEKRWTSGLLVCSLLLSGFFGVFLNIREDHTEKAIFAVLAGVYSFSSVIIMVLLISAMLEKDFCLRLRRIMWGWTIVVAVAAVILGVIVWYIGANCPGGCTGP